MKGVRHLLRAKGHMNQNYEEHNATAESQHHGGEQQHDQPHHLSQEVEEKLDHIRHEVGEIEEIINEEEHHHHPKKYFVEIEGVEHPWNSPTITVADIRRLGNLPSDQPVIEVDACNEERTLAEGEVVHLKPGHRYGKKVRFKRGLDRITAELNLLR